MAENFTIRFAESTLKILKVFGFSAITIVNGKSVTKPWDILFPIVSMTTGCFLIYLSILFQDELATSKSPVIDFGYFVTYVASLVIAMTSMVLAFVFRHHIWSIVLELHEVEKTFRGIGFNEDYKREAIATAVGIFSLMSIVGPMSYSVYVIDGSLLKAGLYFYSGLVFLLSIGSAARVLNAVTVRVKSIVRIFESLLNYPSDVLIITTKEQKDDIEIISTLTGIYARLVKICDSINVCYGTTVMLGYGLLFFYALFVNYMAFKNLLAYGYLDKHTISGLIFCSYLQTFMNAIVLICIMTENATKKIVYVSNKIIRKSKNERKVAMLMAFNSLVSRNQLKFSCELFDFDAGLVYSVRFWIILV